MITPVDTEKATQFSEARVSFDEDFFYIAIIFFNNTIKGSCGGEDKSCSCTAIEKKMCKFSSSFNEQNV